MRNKFLMGCIFLTFGFLAQIELVMAQEVVRDFLGEVNDTDQPKGYKDFVEMQCWECHGFQGQGGVSLPLVANLFPYEAFANQVRHPRNVMPAYSPNVLSEEKLRAIYAYLQNVPPSPDPSDIPLLSGD